MNNCGEKLKAAREFLGLTQDQVASTLNLTRNIVVNIEQNKKFMERFLLIDFPI